MNTTPTIRHYGILEGQHSRQAWMRALLQLMTTKDPSPVLAKSLAAWRKVMAAWQRSQYHGMYEILDYGSTLEIVDARGDTAGLRRREVSRFLQDNGVSIHDHAWGDGEISADYSCQPRTPVESYKDGSKFDVSISLRETKNGGATSSNSGLSLLSDRICRKSQNGWKQRSITGPRL